MDTQQYELTQEEKMVMIAFLEGMNKDFDALSKKVAVGYVLTAGLVWVAFQILTAYGL